MYCNGQPAQHMTTKVMTPYYVNVTPVNTMPMGMGGYGGQP